MFVCSEGERKFAVGNGTCFSRGGKNTGQEYLIKCQTSFKINCKTGGEVKWQSRSTRNIMYENTCTYYHVHEENANSEFSY